MRNLISGLAAALLVAGSVACAGMGEPDPNWDEYRFDQSQFSERFDDEGVFDTWDTDRSGWVDENEFTSASFGVWDANDDRYLDDDEWRTGMTAWGDDDFGMLNDWDRDSDMRVDMNEWRMGVADNDLFETWDADLDTRLDDDELAMGAFDVFDRNSDSIVDDSEWDTGFGTWS